VYFFGPFITPRFFLLAFANSFAFFLFFFVVEDEFTVGGDVCPTVGV
jgi:hypothetical protein